jgi:aminoglycoside 3-N-acetyltransferase
MNSKDKLSKRGLGMSLIEKVYSFVPPFLRRRIHRFRSRRRLNKFKKTKPLTKQDILNDLRKLGLKEGDIVLVHSSLSTIGYVEGGADTVIDALLEAVGPSGTILMPAFPSPEIMADYAKTNPLFDPKNTPSYMGEITEVFRCRKEALRSLSPTHSVAAIGPHAEYLVKDHEKDQVQCGKNSPFFKLIELDGYIVLLGCGVNSLTSCRVLDCTTDNFPVRTHVDEPVPMRYLDHAGVEHTLLVKVDNPAETKNRITDFNVKKQREMYNYFLQYGCLKPGKVGNATTCLITAKALEEVLEMLLARGITIYR